MRWVERADSLPPHCKAGARAIPERSPGRGLCWYNRRREEELLLALLGHQALGWDGDGFNEDEKLTTRGWLFSKALSIAGGTSEVQLNIIAKRVLGLPQQ